MPPIIDAAQAYVTMGEMCDALREVWGVWRETPSSNFGGYPDRRNEEPMQIRPTSNLQLARGHSAGCCGSRLSSWPPASRRS